MAAGKVTRLRIKGFRSINDWVEFDLSSSAPLVLIGENNAGKSNIVKALEMVLGERWPGNFQPEDHELFGRTLEGAEARIHVHLRDVHCVKCQVGTGAVSMLKWKYAKDDNRSCEFTFESDCVHDGDYVSNELRSQLTCMIVGLERDLSWQMSYGSKYTALSKLMHRFHEKLIEDDDRVENLKRIFDEIVETFYEVNEFRSFAEDLKRGSEQFGANLPYALDIDFSAYDPSSFFRSLSVLPSLDDQVRSFDELGTGQQQVLAMAFAYAYAKAFGGSGLILAFEEPEAHLHPLAQDWVAQRLRELAAEDVQVILTTHSPNFIDLAHPGKTVIVRKEGADGATKVTQLRSGQLAEQLLELGAHAERTTSATVGPFYENSATYDMKAALFSRGVLLVEGPTEAAALPVLLRVANLDLVRLGLSIVSVEGIANIAKWLRYFIVHGFPVFPLFDTDSSLVEKRGETATAARKDIFGALGFPKDCDWEGLVEGPIGSTKEFGVFDSNYESSMFTTFGVKYETLSKQAKLMFGGSKPLEARYVARALAKDTDDSAAEWETVKQLAHNIRLLTST